MCISKVSLTVYFDPPFWVGLFQREDSDGCRVCKITFGGEPREQEVLDLILHCWRSCGSARRFRRAGQPLVCPIPSECGGKPEKLLRPLELVRKPSRPYSFSGSR